MIFQNVLTAKGYLKTKIAKAAQALKHISDSKEKKLRKLESTDQQTSDKDYGSSLNNTEDTSVNTTAPVEEYKSTPATVSETGNATAENAPVEASKPVSTVAKTVGNTKAPVQVTKFHSFKAPKGRGLVSFGTYFYFFGRPIV